jgi:hypothetical protein
VELSTDRLVTGSGQEDVMAEQAIALIGFVGEGERGHVRIGTTRDLQAWLDIPEGDIVSSEPVDPDDPGGRAVVRVTRERMDQPVFNDQVDEELEKEFVDGGMSVWALLPESLYVAAGILELTVWPPGAAQQEGRS